MVKGSLLSVAQSSGPRIVHSTSVVEGCGIRSRSVLFVSEFFVW